MISGGEGGEDGSGYFVEGGDLVQVGCCDDRGHGGGVAEGWVAENDGFEIYVEEVAVREEGFGEVRDLWLTLDLYNRRALRGKRMCWLDVLVWIIGE